MGRQAKGTLRHLVGGIEARIQIDDKGTRKGYLLTTCKTEAEAEERKDALAAMAARLRKAGHVLGIDKLLRYAAGARSGRQWEHAVATVEALCSPDGTKDLGSPASPTFEEFAGAWTNGDLHRRYPDHVKAKKDTKRDEDLLRIYIVPHVGAVRLDEFTLDDAEKVMAEIPEERAPATRRHVAQVVRRVLSLAVYPARKIKASPIPPKWLPKVGGGKAKECLFPDEDRTLLRHAETPLVRRLAYGFLAREGMRTDELARLRWRDLDLVRNRVILDENKTDDPRDWAMGDGVLRALRIWKERYHPNVEANEHVFAEAGVPLNVEHLADQLRRDLKRSGVTRPELFEQTATRQQIRAHDLRATFVTMSLATGKTETFVADRTGHKSSGMINRYRRKARTWSGMALGELAPLDGAIPELRFPAKTDRKRTEITGAGGETGRRSGFRFRRRKA